MWGQFSARLVLSLSILIPLCAASLRKGWLIFPSGAIPGS